MPTVCLQVLKYDWSSSLNILNKEPFRPPVLQKFAASDQVKASVEKNTHLFPRSIQPTGQTPHADFNVVHPVFLQNKTLGASGTTVLYLH
uniref:Uncharacterized protein n=1 Tax=Arion vulgaris TaxID=1028688 RepID=A0A0B7B7A0_9EUPU